jgi:large subunit ribosomal protein L40e
MQIYIKFLTGKQVTLEVESSDTIASVKEKIYEKEGLPAEGYKLIYAGKTAEDGKTVEEYGIQDGTALYVAIQCRT